MNLQPFIFMSLPVVIVVQGIVSLDPVSSCALGDAARVPEAFGSPHSLRTDLNDQYCEPPLEATVVGVFSAPNSAADAPAAPIAAVRATIASPARLKFLMRFTCHLP